MYAYYLYNFIYQKYSQYKLKQKKKRNIIIYYYVLLYITCIIYICGLSIYRLYIINIHYTK